jgi:hypothetical protein
MQKPPHVKVSSNLHQPVFGLPNTHFFLLSFTQQLMSFADLKVRECWKGIVSSFTHIPHYDRMDNMWQGALDIKC